MGPVKIVKRPLAYPGHTVLRHKRNGPCAYLGEVITGVNVFLDEAESRDLLRGWGWPTPEQYSELNERFERAQERIAELETQGAELEARVRSSDLIEEELNRLRNRAAA